jgi:hypothetical protein
MAPRAYACLYFILIILVQYNIIYYIDTGTTGLALNDNGLIRTTLENEHEPLKSNQTFLWAVFNEEEKKWFWFFRHSGSTFGRLDRGVPVGIGLSIAL